MPRQVMNEESMKQTAVLGIIVSTQLNNYKKDINELLNSAKKCADGGVFDEIEPVLNKLGLALEAVAKHAQTNAEILEKRTGMSKRDLSSEDQKAAIAALGKKMENEAETVAAIKGKK